jgi:hypothetical protein
VRCVIFNARINIISGEALGTTVASGRLNVVRGIKPRNQIVTLGKSRHIIGL